MANFDSSRRKSIGETRQASVKVLEIFGGRYSRLWFGQSRLLGISLELGSAVAPAFATGSCPGPGSWLTVGVRESSHLEGWTQQGPTHSTNPQGRLIAASGQKQAGMNRASINSPIRQELVVILRLQAKPLTGIYAAHQGSTKASCKTSPSSIGTTFKTHRTNFTGRSIRHDARPFRNPDPLCDHHGRELLLESVAAPVGRLIVRTDVWCLWCWHVCHQVLPERWQEDEAWNRPVG